MRRTRPSLWSFVFLFLRFFVIAMVNAFCRRDNMLMLTAIAVLASPSTGIVLRLTGRFISVGFPPREGGGHPQALHERAEAGSVPAIRLFQNGDDSREGQPEPLVAGAEKQ